MSGAISDGDKVIDVEERGFVLLDSSMRLLGYQRG
jgi:hypothetical protein